ADRRRARRRHRNPPGAAGDQRALSRGARRGRTGSRRGRRGGRRPPGGGAEPMSATTRPPRSGRRFWSAPDPPPRQVHDRAGPRTWEDTRRLLRRLAPVARPYRRRLAAAVSLVVVYALTILAGPYLLKIAIDHGIAESDAGVLNVVVVVYLGVTILSWRVEG